VSGGSLKTTPAEAKRGSFGITHPPFPTILPQHLPSGVILGVGIREILMNNHGSPSVPLRVNGGNDDGDSGLQTSNKRRRIAIACSACRTRKSRVRHEKSSPGVGY
jgi:hypothetical protein